MAELLHCIKFDLPLPDFIDPELSEKPSPVAVKPNPTESDLIQPDPTNLADGHASAASRPGDG
jgi:hypothetical protein